MLPLLLGAGMGLLKGKSDAEQKQRDLQYRAQTAAYSPWTHIHSESVPITEAKGGLMEGIAGGMGGAAFGQSMDAANFANQKPASAEAASPSPWGTGEVGVYSQPSSRAPTMMSMGGQGFSMPRTGRKSEASNNSSWMGA